MVEGALTAHHCSYHTILNRCDNGELVQGRLLGPSNTRDLTDLPVIPVA